VRNPVRLKNLRLRFLPAVVAVGGCLAWIEPRPAPISIGVALVALGLALRAWGAGHLVKREHLSLTGPYAHLRHPLYAGTLLICTGFGLALGPAGWLALAATLVWFYASYFPSKERHESRLLEQRYGAVYASYRARVRALVPSLAGFQPDPGGEPGRAAGGGGTRWSAARYGDNNELGTAVGVGVGVAVLVLRAASV
jgi:protein-S-isoprenylcysteine O-methyltransferase Ste14